MKEPLSYKIAAYSLILEADTAGEVSISASYGHDRVAIDLDAQQMREFASFCTYVADVMEDEEDGRKTA